MTYQDLKQAKEATFTSSFLGFTIKNTGNSDGFVLIDEGTKTTKTLWRSHLGNYSTLQDAQEAALFYFMFDHPEIFADLIQKRALYGVGQCHEFFLLQRAVKEAGLELPKEIKASEDTNFTIVINNKKFGSN